VTISLADQGLASMARGAVSDLKSASISLREIIHEANDATILISVAQPHFRKWHYFCRETTANQSARFDSHIADS
jgi:hypothetical protein